MPMKRKKVHNFYGLVVTDGVPAKLPLKISFSSTNLKFGRIIASNYEEDLAKYQEERAKGILSPTPPIARTYLIGSSTQISQKTGKPFGVFTLEEGLQASEEIIIEALKWKTIVKQAKNNNTLKEHEAVDVEMEVDVQVSSQF